MRQGLLGSTGLPSPWGSFLLTKVPAPALHPASPPSSAPPSPLAGDPMFLFGLRRTCLRHHRQDVGSHKGPGLQDEGPAEECVPPVGLWEVGRWGLGSRLSALGRSPLGDTGVRLQAAPPPTRPSPLSREL